MVKTDNRGTVSLVTDLKAALSKELGKYEKSQNNSFTLSGTFYERCMDILNQLDELPIDFPILCNTLIGTVVSKFKKCPNEEVSLKARGLVKKWKNEAKKGGIEDERSPTKSNASASIQQKRDSISSKKSSTESSIVIPPQWKALAPLRKNICCKFYQMFVPSIGSSEFNDYTSDPNVVEVCTDIESAIQDFSKKNISVYKEKARSLSFNLKRNSSLRDNILNGSVSPTNLMTMTTEQLATQEKQAAREKLEKDLQESRRLDWEQANEDKINEMCGIKGELLKASLFTCSRCKSTKTTSTQKQTRSADEPMTVFVFCLNCGNRWKC